MARTKTPAHLKSKKIANQVLKENHRIVLLRQIITDILRGYRYSQIIDKIKEDKYNMGKKCNEKKSKDLYNEAHAILINDMKEEANHLKDKMVSRAMDVYEEARGENDRVNALKALEMINKTFGLYEADRMRAEIDVHKHKVVINFGLGDQGNEAEEAEEETEVNGDTISD